ncbi:[protein release factor]-glutamine N5-methyltransferase [Roseovarius azorensis]|uniref:Release factor glutamine methyltransferase n=1 Tax=Roseovarius azorensis TaxID=1287727 RepID=A0A1H7H973_9RHOB|nr:peptide chain release factor N(5)-glutamine methyltransferase [Roseovarius azorensis]SEK45852.1 [protein release factor]-glutamine N5-methyltransferase [Roseovarius azorensis]
MSAQAALSAAVRALEAAGIEGASRDARILLAEAMAVTRDRLTLHLADDLPPEVQARFEAMIARRADRAPVSRIIGRRAFWGRDFAVTPEVLDPRPETECLIAAALGGPVPQRLLDLGTGSGIIAVTLLAEWPDARGVACDISPAALEVAVRNAARHGVSGRLDLIVSDWFGAVRGRFDLIASNPPYIAADEMAGLAEEVRGHDPRAALTDEGDGLAAYRVIAGQAGACLCPGGRILVETGWRQGAAVAALFDAEGFAQVAILPDLEGRDRVIGAVWPG